MSFSSATFLRIQKVAPIHLPKHTSTELTEGSFILIWNSELNRVN